MRKIFAAVAGVSMLGFAAGASAAELPSAEQSEEPILLTAVEMDEVTAGLANVQVGVNLAQVNQIAVLSGITRQTSFIRQSIRQRLR